MTARSITPDHSALDVPWDAWSEPFWQATAQHTLLMPRCGDCATFRWPAGPFCPKCQSQQVEWVPPGQARIYSFTILPVPSADKDAPPRFRVPVLAEFDDAPGVRLVSVLIDQPMNQIAIGDSLTPDWIPAANATIPVFRKA